MLKITNAKYAGEYKIEIHFNNGQYGIADLKETIKNDKRPIFTQLQDITAFRDFRESHGTVIWSNNADMAPEYLYYIAFKNIPEYQELFGTWGYV